MTLQAEGEDMDFTTLMLIAVSVHLGWVLRGWLHLRY
jgi:hypothetical protein